MDTLVALDIETTGLDPERDAIIEIGVVRFRGSRVEDEWETLVNPGCPIPSFVQQLTGIDDSMLAGAPRLSSVLGDLKAFVGDLPLLGHSLRFDLSFLQRKGLFQLNQVMDTYDLASVLLPSASRYSLASLIGELNVPVRMKELHRALEDAHATRMVFLRLCDLAAELPLGLIDEIARLGAEMDWGAGWLFDHALQERLKQAGSSPKKIKPWRPNFPPAEKAYAPLKPVSENAPLDAEEVAAAAEPGGALSNHFPGYEFRSQQVTMLQAVARALSESRHLLVEAGTGTGKSMAYLIPAFAWASQNGRRVVVSTNTINLQDQLIHKDTPDLCQALKSEYQAAVLKGRANYLCPRRLESWRRLGPQSPEEIRVAAKILVWLYQGGSGDRGEINLRSGGESAAWGRLSADNPDCSIERCAGAIGGACPYYKARQSAESAHVIIVNHALLLADIATGNRVIPEYQYLIVDEAHHLEAATTKALSVEVSERMLQSLLRELHSGPTGLLNRVSKMAKKGLPSDAVEHVERQAATILDRTRECQELASTFFKLVTAFLDERREGRPLGFYEQRERIVPSSRKSSEWAAIEMGWENLRAPLALVVKASSELGEWLSELVDQGIGPAEDLAVATRIVSRSLENIHKDLEQIVFEPQPSAICWAQATPQQALPSLHMAPLEVGPLVEKYLWFEKESVIMTSATLTTGEEFDFIRRRLGATDAEELALGSPFDYESSTLLYLVNDIPEPATGEGYEQALQRGLTALAQATHGRTLALFTSYAHMRRAAGAIARPLEKAGIRVIEQVSGAPRHTLLETFRNTEKAVLLGTRSFWEGVDVPGPALSVLAIARLPFGVPTDPITAARAETHESPFDQYSVPEAVLRFRQGFGRLIRTRSDRGVAVIFDRRVTSKSYGPLFIRSLPTCTVRQGPMAELPSAAARWLGD